MYNNDSHETLLNIQVLSCNWFILASVTDSCFLCTELIRYRSSPTKNLLNDSNDSGWACYDKSVVLNNVIKACARYFLFFYQMRSLIKLWKMLFISSKRLFPFSRYSNFCISIFLSFSPCRPLLWKVIEDKY